MRSAISISVLGCAVFAISAASPPDLITIGVAKSLLPEVSEKKFDGISNSFQRVLAQQTGLRGALRSVETADELSKLVADGAMQMGVFRGVEFGATQAKTPGLKALMIGEVDADVLVSAIVVAKSASAGNMGECHGMKLALATGTREDNRLFLEKSCRDLGSTAQKHFGDVSNWDTPEEALDSIVDGMAQATVVDMATLKMFEGRKPGRFAKLKVIAMSEPFPPCAIAIKSGVLDAATLQRFCDGMRTAHNTGDGGRLLSLLRCRRFDLPPENYLALTKKAATRYSKVN